ncbi:hypothetical protein [Arthrobacter sp. B0490]|uniref:hypothetical protein n=1 Tax=Arthrobacter sp. B0490 TaxID=2058891 RepID=UPI000CE48D93|nr:hypothetical protein [Arthrobacter sp. B0490]
MDATEDMGCEIPPIRLVAVNPAGSEPATRIPTDGPLMDVPDEAGIDTSPFVADETDVSDFEKNIVALRAGDSGQTLTAMAEPTWSPETIGAADGDGD